MEDLAKDLADTTNVRFGLGGLVLGILLSLPLATAGAQPTRFGLLASGSLEGDAWAPTGGIGIAEDASYVDPVLVAQLTAAESAVAIVVFDPAHGSSIATALASLSIVHHFFANLHMAALQVNAEQVALVANLPGVQTVYHNEQMSKDLSDSVPYIGASAVRKICGCGGAGTTILVVDSGIDGTHPDLAYGKKLRENAVPVRDGDGFVRGHREGVISSDPDGHGTHVASIVAGTGASKGAKGETGLVGVAPQSRIVGFQAGFAAADETVFDSMTVLEAFDYGLAKRRIYQLGIVSNSWGANGEFDSRSPINQATLILYKAGFLVVFAAGNEGSHGLNKYSVAPWVLGVAAGNYANGLADFSSRGRSPENGGKPYDHPDLVAPGVEIAAARANANGPARAASTPNAASYVRMSGTSMAAPHVAGAAAILLGSNPKLSPDDLMEILTATATRLPYEPWEAGAGFVNVLSAHRLAVKTVGNRAEFLAGHMKYGGRESGDPEFARDALSGGSLIEGAHALSSADLSIRGLRGGIGAWRLLAFGLVAGPLLCGNFGVRWQSAAPPTAAKAIPPLGTPRSGRAPNRSPARSGPAVRPAPRARRRRHNAPPKGSKPEAARYLGSPPADGR